MAPLRWSAFGAWCKKVTSDNKAKARFDVVTSTIILVYAVVMLIETDYPDLPWVKFADYAFILLFTIEIAVRLTGNGCYTYFTGDERMVNIFDFLVTLGGGAGLLLSPDSKISGIMPLLRCLRVLRLLRLVRLFGTFPELRKLLVGIGGAAKSVGWVTIMFGLIIMMSAIGIRLVVKQNTFTYQEEIDQHFGSVMLTAITLFQFVTLDDWCSIARYINHDLPIFEPIWVVFIFFTNFTILSLLTGVVTEVVGRAGEDPETKKKEEQRQYAEFCTVAREVFAMADTNESGDVTWEEWQEAIPKMQTKILDLKMDVLALMVDEASMKDVFRCMDVDGSGAVTFDEFERGVLLMRGPAGGMDILRVTRKVQALRRRVQAEKIRAPSVNLAPIRDLLANLSDGAELLARRVFSLEDALIKAMPTYRPYELNTFAIDRGRTKGLVREKRSGFHR